MSDAARDARATMLVMPRPYSSKDHCSEGARTRSVNPEPYRAFQNRFPGRAKC